MGPSPLWESTGITSSCLLLFSSSLGAVVGTGGSEKTQKKDFKMSSDVPAYWKWSQYIYIFLSVHYFNFFSKKKPHTQTFNGEVELVGVLASIGGHPALPQPSLLSSQTRNLKQGCTFIRVHDSPRGLRVKYVTHNGNAIGDEKSDFHFLRLFFAAAWICAQNVLTLRNFLVPVGNVGTILYQIISIIKEAAQKE